MTNPAQPASPRQIRLPPSREELDLPTGTVVQTFHNAISTKTITEIRLSDRLPIHNLYWRPVGGTRYASVHQLSQDQSLENAVNCNASWIYARLQTWTKRERGYGSSSNDIVRIDMTSDPCMETLSLTDVLPGNAIVHRLIRSDDSGTRLQAVIRFSDPHGRGHRMRYAICALDLASRNLMELDTLTGIEY